MTQLTRQFLESKGFYESCSIETGYRSQFTATTEDHSFYLSFLSTFSILENLKGDAANESFEVVIGNETLRGNRWTEIPTKIIVSTVEQFDILLSMLNVKLKLIENEKL